MHKEFWYIIFKNLKDYHDKYNLSPIYYANIPSIHCLYDAILPSLTLATTFIINNLNENKLKK